MRLILIFLVMFGCNNGEKKIRIEASKFPEPTAAIPPLQPAPRVGFVSLDIVEDQMLLDVLSIESSTDRLNARYLLACDIYNIGTERLLDVEQGANKFINSISTESRVERVTPIGNTNCAYRIDIDEYGLDSLITYKGKSIPGRLNYGSVLTKWQLLERIDIVFVVSQSARNQNLQFQTQSLRPYVFLNSITVSALEGDDLSERGCNVYCELVDQPRDRAGFFQSLGVNVQQEYNDEAALYEANSLSQIAIGKSRGYEILDSDDGWVWSSFDSVLGGDKDHFETPFKLEAANAGGVVRSDKVFDQDASERIYSLDNECLGVRLENAAGLAVSVAPATVVNHTKNATSRIDVQIRNGDCVGCHKIGPIPFVGQIRNHVLSNSSFNAGEKDLARVFSDPVEIGATQLEIQSDYIENCLDPLGIGSDADQLTESISLPFRVQLNAEKLCSYTFLDTPECLERLRGTDKSSQVYGNVLNGGTVSLATFEKGFAVFVQEMGIFKDVSIN
jgi:hypothetical protein